jgi:hypothetical protein
MVGAVVAQDFEAGMDRAALCFVRSVNEARDTSLKHGAGAHRAGFDGDVQRGAEKTVVAEAVGGFAERENFGVGSGITMRDSAISRAGHDFFVEDKNCANGDFAAICGFAGFGEGFGHEGQICF